MGFASFQVQAKKHQAVQVDDQGFKDLSIDEISSVDSSDDEDEDDTHHTSDPLNDMSSLLQQLPIKRGLSRHFEGKSQSFTSLSNVRCLEDLAKPEHPYNKRLKSCKSYEGFYGENQIRSNEQMSSEIIIPKSASSRLISKKTSRGSSCSSFINSGAKRNNNSNPRPPAHPLSYRSSDAQTLPLFEAKDSLRCAVPFFTS